MDICMVVAHYDEAKWVIILLQNNMNIGNEFKYV